MKKRDLHLTKITRPTYRGVLKRERLFRLLDRCRSRPAVWVSGPAGCGKTTLVSSYIDYRKPASIWYQVDADDGDAATFFHYMGLAAAEAAGLEKSRLPAFDPEHSNSLHAFARRYFQDLFANLPAPFIITLDNYQDAPEDSLLHEVLSFGFTEIPQGGNVIVISRNGTPPALARLVVNEKIDVIDSKELSLTPEESKGIVRIRGLGKDMKDDAVRELHRMAGGWAAGFVLLIEKVRRSGFGPWSLKGLDLYTVLDYFASEIFERLDESTRDFLLKTAFLPRMTPGMAERLTGLEHSERMLAALTRSNCFTEKRLHGEGVYQYHPLFKEFLLYHARNTFKPEDIAHLMGLAASLLEEAGYTEDALGFLCETGDYGGLARLVKLHARTLVEHGRFRFLENQLDRLPPGTVEQDPWLLYWRGVCRFNADRGESLGCFEKAFDLFITRKDPEGVFLSWSWAVDSILQGTCGCRRLDYWITALDRAVKEFPSYPTRESEGMVATAIFGAMVFRQPSSPLVPQLEERAVELSRVNRDVPMSARVWYYSAYYNYLKGDWGKFHAAVDRLRELVSSVDATPQAAKLCRLAEALYCWSDHMYAECLRAVEAGLSQGRSTGISPPDFIMCVYGAASSMCMGDASKAGRYLERMASSLDSAGDMCASLYHLLCANEALSRCEAPLAVERARRGLKCAKAAGAPSHVAINHLSMADALFENGQHRKAAAHLARAKSFARSARSGYFDYMCAVTEARFALSRGNGDNGLKSLKKALELGGSRGYGNFLFWRPDLMCRLFTMALDAGIDIKHVQDLIRRCGIVCSEPPVDIENWPWHLKIYTMGRFGVVRDSKPLRFERKGQQKPLELLKLLIASGGRGVSEEHLTDTLWPGTEGDAARQAFSTTLHRLRHLLGIGAAVLRSEGRVTLNQRYCWVDIWAFERVVGKTDAALNESQRDRRDELVTTLADRALKLYQGHFLESDTDRPWTISCRERLRSKFFRHISTLSGYLCKAGKCDRAVAYYQKGIDLDNLAEGFYQGLMECYICLGRMADAAVVYERLKKTLSAALGVDPSPRTEAIYRNAAARDA